MKFLDRQAAIGAAILLLSVPSHASHSHLETLDKRHAHAHHHHHKKAQSSPRVEGLGEAVQEVKKRGVCQFPTDAGLQAVTPGALNAGWAMAPDMPCVPGMYCPYACPSGQLMAQWDPASVTSYQADTRTHGGLYCDPSGAISKPFPDKPYCVPGVGNVKVQNDFGDVHSVCQTMLPGYEDMLAGTEVPGGSSKTLAVPDTSYWLGTAAHYYHNGPGVSVQDGCKWGDNQHDVGNWAPYVSGANMAADGNTYVKLAWNPIYLEPASKYVNVLPDWGMSITCDHDGCNGLPCAIDPSINNINAMVGGQATGAGGGDFCVVTVPAGNTAIITVFKAGSLGSDGKPKANAVAAPSSESSSTSSSKSTPTTSSTTSSIKSTTTSSTSTTHTTSSSTTASSISTSVSYAPHVLFQNGTSTTTMSSSTMASLGTTSTAKANATSVIASATAVLPTGNAASSIVASSGRLGLGALLAAAFACLL